MVFLKIGIITSIRSRLIHLTIFNFSMKGQYWLVRCKALSVDVRPWLAPQNGTGDLRGTKYKKKLN